MFYDLDGTLIDSIDHIVDCWQHTSRICLGREMTREEIIPLLGRSLVECFEEYAPGRSEELREVYRVRQQQTHNSTVKLIPGTHETLDALKGVGVKLGVVTSKGIKVANEGLDLFGLRPYFDITVTHEETERHKPFPDPLLLGCLKLGIEPAQAIYVGDAVFDILAGKAAGTVTAGVTWGAGTLETLKAAQPDYIFTQMPQVLQLFPEQVKTK